MTRTVKSLWRRTGRFFVPLIGLSGCHHTLHPGPVHYPPPPPLCCPPQLVTLGPPAGETSTKSEHDGGMLAEPQLIDLPTALRLVDSQNPQIAVARERIRQALAVQERLELYWVPNLEIGSTWMRHDGQIQRSVGDVFTTSRSSLFAGGSAVLSLDTSEAVFNALAAAQLTNARRAGAIATTNDRMLDVAVAYFDLLQVYGELQINAETTKHAKDMLAITESYERSGKGAAADTARARAEVNLLESERLAIESRVGVVSARLAQLLLLPPGIPLRPVEAAIFPVHVIPEDVPLSELIAQGLMNRPELSENRAYIEAALERWRGAKTSPWVPNLRLAYSAGGFGGGVNEFFGDFNGRGDFSAGAFWQLLNFGLGNRALIRDRRSQFAQATIRQDVIEAEVAEEIVASFSIVYARRRQLAAAEQAVASAVESYRLNEDRIRRAPEQGRPIELLQAIQALNRARRELLLVAADYDRAQFRLYTGIGTPSLCAMDRVGAGDAGISSPVPAS